MAPVIEMEPSTNQRPEEESLESKALTWPERAKSIAVTDQESCERAANVLLDVAAMRKEIQEHHAPLKKKAHEAHKAICDAEAKLLEPVAEAEKILKGAISKYQLEEQRKAEEARRIAEEQAQREADEAREAEIEAAEAAGASAEEIQSIVEQPVIPTVPVVVTPAPQVPKGLASMTQYKGVVTSLPLLLKAAVEGKVPMSLVQANETALNQFVRATKGTVVIPGVRVVEEVSVKTTGRGR